jgi:carbon storage regulator CsrA
MLKITRKPGEGLTLITSDGEIHIDVEIKSGKQIRLAIDAPDNVGIWRDELLKRISFMACGVNDKV